MEGYLFILHYATKYFFLNKLTTCFTYDKTDFSITALLIILYLIKHLCYTYHHPAPY